MEKIIKIYKRTNKTRENISLSKLGNKNPMYGKEPWNKGLTKETDGRVRKYGENGCITRKRLYKEGKIKTNSKTLKRKYASGELIHPMLGKKNPSTTKRNLENNPMENIETRKKSGKTISRLYKEGKIKTNSKIMKKLWQDKEYKIKQREKMFNGLKLKPNKPEKFMINLVNENFPDIFHYTGDGKVIIEGFCPDFVCNPSKKIIEVFGDYWHNLPSYKKRDKRRLKEYKKYGFETLIVWEHELKNPFKIINKIEKFIR